MKRALSLLALGLVLGCGSDPPPPPKTADAAPTPPPPAPPPTANNPKPDDDPKKSNINISDEIRKACGITDAEAFFAYDSANVREQDKAVLTKLATCFTTGPLKGREMRLVGPRPITVGELTRYGSARWHYLSVTPGMTGLWQVSGRNRTSYARRVALDRHYVERRTLAMDLAILLRTVKVVLERDGAL